MALALIAAPGAKANVAETFTLKGDFGTILGPLTPFSGTANLDFSSNFATDSGLSAMPSSFDLVLCAPHLNDILVAYIGIRNP